MFRIQRLPVVALLLALVALLLPLAAARSAMAIPDQPMTPEQILEECIEMMEEVVEETVSGIELQTTYAVATINSQKASGATEKKINKTAKRAKKSLSNTARGGHAQINRITGSCMIRLRRMGAEPEINGALAAARSGALSAMYDAAEEGVDLIDDAVAGTDAVESDTIPGAPL